MSNKIWGATPEEWALWRSLRPEHLLPTVCNPEATVSKNSELYRVDKTTGNPVYPAKIPSLYNRKKNISGISKWVSLPVSPAMLDIWQQEPDYGICIRTGHGWLALDCDSESPDIQRRIAALLSEHFSTLPPRRYRADSNKCLYLLAVEGDFRKRVHRQRGGNGLIELLAGGQQAVIAGSHPGGARIGWDRGLSGEPLAITAEQLEAFWAALAEALPVAISADAGTGRLRDRSQGTPGATDDVADWLDINSLTLGSGADGERYICCPFREGHSGESGMTSTVYFPAGTGGFELGHFKCLHASCAHRNDGDYLNKIGYRDGDFDDVTSAELTEYLPLPAFTRDKQGLTEGTVTNVLLALRRPDLCGVHIRLDEFRNEIILTTRRGKHIPLRDEYYTRLHETLECKLQFKKFQETEIKRAVRLVAYENRYDSLKAWVNSLPEWDGVARIDTFFCRHWRIDDSAYTRAAGRYWWTLLAGRALVPGIKGDMAVVLVSQQGKNKSEGIRAMAPTPEHYMGLDFEKPAAERIREMRGHNVIELGEMRGMNKRGTGEVRVTISTRADRNRGLYREHYDTLPRRCGFIATVNTDTPLTDTEGNRRWLLMTIPDDTDGKYIAQGIGDEKLQLWAEGAVVFRREGIAWERAETLAKSILGDYEAKNEVWMSCIAEWLEAESADSDDAAGRKNCERVLLTSKDLLVRAIGFNAPQVKRGDEMKVAGIMKDLGYKKERLQSIPGKPYHWEKSD